MDHIAYDERKRWWPAFCHKSMNGLWVLGRPEVISPKNMATITEQIPMGAYEIFAAHVNAGALLDLYTGDIALVISRLAEFEEKALASATAIRDHAANAQYDGVVLAAHLLQGVAGAIAAEGLQRLAAAIEATARLNDRAQLRPLLHKLGNEIQCCFTFISVFYQDHGVLPAPAAG